MKKRQVDTFCDVEVFLDNNYRFIADPGEGNDLRADTWSNICEKISKYFDKKKQGKKKKLPPVEVFKIEDSRGKDILLKCKVTGIHSGTGHPIVKVGEKPATQDGYCHHGYMKPMTKDQIAEWVKLRDENVKADAAYRKFLDLFDILNLGDYAQSVWNKVT